MFPLENDAVVLGLLAVSLAGIFYAAQQPSMKKFFTFVPTLLLCYFVPAAFNSLGIVDGEASSLYFVSSRYLLPASLVLLCLSIDLKGIYNLGPKAIIMFFAATTAVASAATVRGRHGTTQKAVDRAQSFCGSFTNMITPRDTAENLVNDAKQVFEP